MFILCIEALACEVRSNDKIEGCEAHGITKKIGLVADDTVFTLKAMEECMEELRDVLKDFELQSGLHVNYDKSVVCPLGTGAVNYKLIFHEKLIWLKEGESFQYLGLTLKKDNKGHLVDRGN